MENEKAVLVSLPCGECKQESPQRAVDVLVDREFTCSQCHKPTRLTRDAQGHELLMRCVKAICAADG